MHVTIKRVLSIIALLRSDLLLSGGSITEMKHKSFPPTDYEMTRKATQFREIYKEMDYSQFQFLTKVSN